jgi:hypothetical protein
MALNDPVAVYNAANNVEAQFVSNTLRNAGIESHVTEDVSQVGVWLFGLLPEIHKPQVWVDRNVLDQAKPILADYERGMIERQEAEGKKVAVGEATIEAVCEECGHLSLFPAEQTGTVQDCPCCGAYVDVGESPDSEEWWLDSESSDDIETNH